jgi:hypothetical protein
MTYFFIVLFFICLSIAIGVFVNTSILNNEINRELDRIRQIHNRIAQRRNPEPKSLANQVKESVVKSWLDYTEDD